MKMSAFPKMGSASDYRRAEFKVQWVFVLFEVQQFKMLAQAQFCSCKSLASNSHIKGTLVNLSMCFSQFSVNDITAGISVALKNNNRKKKNSVCLNYTENCFIGHDY